VFDFSASDAIAKLAKSNGQLLRCHALVWYQDLPDWVAYGQWSRQSLIDALWTHITTVVDHYKGACYSWDVVNEALMEDGGLRDNIFLDIIG
jgi:endo-1,4-beta-xylanase